MHLITNNWLQGSTEPASSCMKPHPAMICVHILITHASRLTSSFCWFCNKMQEGLLSGIRRPSATDLLHDPMAFMVKDDICVTDYGRRCLPRKLKWFRLSGLWCAQSLRERPRRAVHDSLYDSNVFAWCSRERTNRTILIIFSQKLFFFNTGDWKKGLSAYRQIREHCVLHSRVFCFFFVCFLYRLSTVSSEQTRTQKGMVENIDPETLTNWNALLVFEGSIFRQKAMWAIVFMQLATALSASQLPSQQWGWQHEAINSQRH